MLAHLLFRKIVTQTEVCGVLCLRTWSLRQSNFQVSPLTRRAVSNRQRSWSTLRGGIPEASTECFEMRSKPSNTFAMPRRASMPQVMPNPVQQRTNISSEVATQTPYVVFYERSIPPISVSLGSFFAPQSCVCVFCLVLTLGTLFLHALVVFSQSWPRQSRRHDIFPKDTDHAPSPSKLSVIPIQS